MALTSACFQESSQIWTNQMYKWTNKLTKIAGACSLEVGYQNKFEAFGYLKSSLNNIEENNQGI